MRYLAALGLTLPLCFMPLAILGAQPRDEARPQDLQRLQEDLANLDDALQTLDQNNSRSDDLRRRAEEIREEVIYLKVKMRRQEQTERGGWGVSSDEVAELRRAIRALREDVERASERGERRDVRVDAGTVILVRLDEPLSSRTARREDRFEASVFRPVRSEGVLAIPAGAQVRGIVRDCEPAERPSRSGRLDLEFDALYLDQLRLDLRGRVVALHGEEERRDTAEKAGLGAVLGGVIGGILGGKKGALVGLLVGGTGAVVATTGEDVELPPGTVLRVRLERPLIVPRR